jgi:hypothetical protein
VGGKEIHVQEQDKKLMEKNWFVGLDTFFVNA